MSAKISYKFFGYELRPATDADLDLARAWTEADPAHAGKIAPNFWIEQGIGVDSFVLVDADGPIFFMRMQKAVRLLIQFGPDKTKEERRRTREALAKGLRWLEVGLGCVSVGELLFDSSSRLLRLMCTGKLGFTAKPDSLSKPIPILRRRATVAPIPTEVMESIERREAATQHTVL